MRQESKMGEGFVALDTQSTRKQQAHWIAPMYAQQKGGLT